MTIAHEARVKVQVREFVKELVRRLDLPYRLKPVFTGHRFAHIVFIDDTGREVGKFLFVRLADGVILRPKPRSTKPHLGRTFGRVDKPEWGEIAKWVGDLSK